MENIFSSRPGDFLKYGIYTCRFYVNEEWVDLITDTNIPCLRNSLTGKMPVLMFVYVYICVCVCMYVCMYVCIFTRNSYIHSNIQKKIILSASFMYRCSKASIWAVNQPRRDVGLLCGEVIRQSDGQLRGNHSAQSAEGFTPSHRLTARLVFDLGTFWTPIFTFLNNISQVVVCSKYLYMRNRSGWTWSMKIQRGTSSKKDLRVIALYS